MKLCESLFNNGYHVYFDNFFTAGPLLDDLLKQGILACGTSQKGRVGYPMEFKSTETYWNKTSKQGDMRWFRDGDKLFVQWKDKRMITMMTTIHNANKSDVVKRKQKKKGGGWDDRDTVVRRPWCFRDYNRHMGGVDLSDQLIGKYNVLRKVNRWWKTIFFHLIDIASVNSYILLKASQTQYNIDKLKRKKRYGQPEFREELVAQWTHVLDKDESEEESEDAGQHEFVLGYREGRNCGWCYHMERLLSSHGKECRVTTFCSSSDKNFLPHQKKKKMYVTYSS